MASKQSSTATSASPPEAAMSAATTSSLARLRPARNTFAPSRAKTSWSFFDERPQAFGRVVPLRRDLVEVPLCYLEAFAVQVPDPLTPPAGVAHEPHTP